MIAEKMYVGQEEDERVIRIIEDMEVLEEDTDHLDITKLFYSGFDNKFYLED